MSIGANDNWWVTVEGVGDYDNVADSTRARLYRFSMSLARWETDPAPLYKPWLVRNSIKVSKNNLDFRAGRSSSGGGAFALKMKDLVLATFERFRHPNSGHLTAEADEDDTFINTSSTAGLLANTVQYIDREAIFFGAHVGAFPGRYQDCVRGIFETVAQPHKILHKIYPSIKAINRRQVTIGYTPEGSTSYADEVVFRKFQLQDDGTPHALTYEADLDGWLAMLSMAPVLPKQWVGIHLTSFGDDDGRLEAIAFTGSPDPGSASLILPMTFRRPNGRSPAPADGDRVLVEIDGGIYRGTLAAYQTDAADPSVIAGFRVDVHLDRDAMYGTPASNLKVDDAAKLTCREIFASDSRAPDNGVLPGGKATSLLPLGGDDSNMLTYVLQVLTSTEWGTNGDYDTAVPFGLGMPHTAIDISGIESLRARSVGLTAPRFFLGREADASAKVMVLLQRELRAAGFAFAENEEGVFSIVGMEDSSLVAVDTLRDAELVFGTLIKSDNGTANTIDSVAIRYDRGGDGRTRPLVFTDDENSEERLGPEQSDDLDAGSWTNAAVARQMGFQHLERWRNRTPKLRCTAKIKKNFNTGQAIEVTSDHVVGIDPSTKDPVIGVTGSRAVVVHVDPVIGDGTTGYQLLHTGLKYDNLGNIAGTMVALSETLGVLTIQDNVFIPLDPVSGVVTHPVWDHDREAFAVTDKVALISEFGVNKGFGVIDSFPVSDVEVEISAFIGIVASGDYVVHRDWDDMTAGQKARLTALAKANGAVGATDDPGFQYEG